MSSKKEQPVMRSLLRKQQAPSALVSDTSARQDPARDESNEPQVQESEADPHCLLDADTWALRPAAVAGQLSGRNPDFSAVGVLGPQGLGKSALLNLLLGLNTAEDSPAAAPAHTPAFPVCRHLAAALPALQHCTRGVQLRVSSDRIIGLDTQPLFSASVLEEMAVGWEQPPAALAAPAVAAAGDAKAAAVPYEGVQALAELQLAVFLLSTCQRVVVLCDGTEDRRTWELVLTAEMLARGVPDPSLPPRDPAPAASTGAAATGGAAASQHPHTASQHAAAGRGRQAGPAVEHLAEVVLVHVLPPGGGDAPPSAELQALEARLAAYFASSRLYRPGPLRMQQHMAGRHGSAGCSPGSGSGKGMSYWVLPSPGGSPSAWQEAASGLVAALLARPCPPFAQRCPELGWLRGVADVWRAVRRSPDIATFYSRVARTQLKGGGGWALA